ncbi:RagB/SusD family nutrient uptake outer membrane protein [Flavobacterium branchiophilum NBRC 15030 = ATCC 35035]|uniref:Putative outer membrane starch-binding protein n=1 Tax=Flavobacterium branchiophilum TaxID=55197 RepID=A0A543G6V5_9FLAO|nr:RagB/SusD family nutrient uptake outer membrane protein [Flavobacterium branchiophilum]OXA72778.1 RagB/SusD family nutrient uptake outer membrane protein [Flavobacterium branchiophilum NBRC 15030 = ATCC 35035]TQM41825.1 putative outer membrane starch-binding protein [Flavobacterium branchiophilum]GEM56380.1 membrane protein [Flavobacterium branchiophilum NBRC 15030 = ATCC 35035]
MKIKNLKYFVIAGLSVTALTSCTKDFLEQTPTGQYLSANYYQNKDQAFSGLVAVYDGLRKNSGGFENMITMMNAGSDDHVAGGGGSSDGIGIQAFSNYTASGTTMPVSFWNDHFQGIANANILLQKLPNTQMDNNEKVRFVAETKALRALYYFNLVRMFKNIPLILEPVTTENMYNIPQATPAAVYTQIENDLLSAINDLPTSIPSSESGRISKGAAKAILGKVYLYNGKNALAAAQLAEVNGTPGSTSAFGYKLLSNFSDLWNTSNKFNSESILEVAHTSTGNSYWGIWGSGKDEGNSVNVMVGPRGYVKISPSAPSLPSGWSFNMITQDLYDAIKLDPRFGATVLDLKAMKLAGTADYIAGYQDTGYFLNKFVPRQSDVTTGQGDAVLNYKQDTYVIRLADTYLLEAEALGGTGARAQALLDAVRARVGLASVPVSLTAIKNERRLELAGEGHRFFDLVRWGDAATKLASRGFVAGKHEIFPIPYKELENTKLVQNPGYN